MNQDDTIMEGRSEESRRCRGARSTSRMQGSQSLRRLNLRKNAMNLRSSHRDLSIGALMAVQLPRVSRLQNFVEWLDARDPS